MKKKAGVRGEHDLGAQPDDGDKARSVSPITPIGSFRQAEKHDEYVARAIAERDASDRAASEHIEQISKASFDRFVKYALLLSQARKALMAETRLKGVVSKNLIDYDLAERLLKIFDSSISRIQYSSEYYESFKKAVILPDDDLIKQLQEEERKSPDGSIFLVALFEAAIHRKLIG